jgi:hypothetical protein
LIIFPSFAWLEGGAMVARAFMEVHHGYSSKLDALRMLPISTRRPGRKRPVAAQRAAEVGKKLMKGSLDIVGELNPEADFMVGRRLDGEYRQKQGPNDSELEKQ